MNGRFPVLILQARVDNDPEIGQAILEFQVVVLDPTFRGRRVPGQIVLRDECDPDAERRGRAALSALCRSAGLSRLDYSSDLIGHRATARVAGGQVLGDWRPLPNYVRTRPNTDAWLWSNGYWTEISDFDFLMVHDAHDFHTTH